jgi:hypothetical protein
MDFSVVEKIARFHLVKFYIFKKHDTLLCHAF